MYVSEFGSRLCIFLRSKRPVMYGGVSPLRGIDATYSVLFSKICFKSVDIY